MQIQLEGIAWIGVSGFVSLKGLLKGFYTSKSTQILQ